MAIYHFNTQIISRSHGRSIVACAAYRAGELLQDERHDKVHDYEKKQDVAHSEILLPKNAPDFMLDREKLWNHVEAIEKRKDSQLAREAQFSLPRELTLSQNIELTREFVKKTFVDSGMVADFSIHLDKGKDGEAQPHVHVLLSTREVSEDGLGFGLKNTDWNKKERLLEWREAWADVANRHLALYGHDIRIDHRSYEVQGIELEPQYKIGTAIAQERMARLADHQRIARENGERIYHDPSIALDALTRQQSTFTHQDLARLVNRQTEDAEQFQKVYEKVQSSLELVKLGVDEQGRERLTTREMLDIESTMLKNAALLNERSEHAVKQAALVTAVRNRSLSEEQRNALEYVTGGKGLCSVVGFAGTGKSYMLGAAREVWEESGYRVQGVALSGIAAQNLEQSSGIASGTVSSLLYRLDKGNSELTSRDVVVVDEAGMLGSRQMERIISAAQENGAKVVLVGDWQQLQAIEAGAAFRAIAEEHHYAELNQVRRQKVDWQRDCTLDLARGNVGNALRAYRSHDNVHEYATQAEAKEALLRQWNDTRHSNPEESSVILAYTRKEVQELNEMARELKKTDGELGQDYRFDTERGERHFAVGDRVYFLKRDDNLHVVNGTLGTIRAVEGDNGRLQVELDRNDLASGQRIVSVDTNEYKHLDHGYAATVYKAQGVTVDRSYLLASKYYDAHSAYVGMSRHRESCDIFTSKQEFVQERDLERVFARDRTKDVTLDYTQPENEFARQRSIKPDSVFARVRALPRRIKEKGKEYYEKRVKSLLEKKSAEEKQRFLEQSQKRGEMFREKHPEQAKAIAKTLQPEHEKQVGNYMQKFKQYEQGLRQNTLSPKDRAELVKDTKAIATSVPAMNYIRQHQPEFALKMQRLTQELEKQRQLQLERSKGHQLGL